MLEIASPNSNTNRDRTYMKPGGHMFVSGAT